MRNSFLPIVSATLIGAFFFGGCAQQNARQQEPEEDIYAALRDDNYSSRPSAAQNDQGKQREQGEQGSSPHVNDRIAEVRNLYFEQAYVEAAELSERLVHLAPYDAENFYWLARIKLAQNEVKDAHEFATRGISLTDNSALKRELKRIQRRAEIGF